MRPSGRVVADRRPLMVRLARLRVPLGFLSGLLVLWLSRPSVGSVAWGAVVAAMGEGLRVWAAGHLNKAREVTTSGPYRWMAHPLYVGSSIMGVGLAIASNSLLVAALIVVYLAATLTAAIQSEEAFLRRTFGTDYDRYRRPAAGDAAAAGANGASDRRRFSAAQALANHEPRAILGLLAAVLLLFLKATYNGSF